MAQTNKHRDGHRDTKWADSVKAGYLCLLVGGHPHPDVFLLAGRVPQRETDHLGKRVFTFTWTILKCLSRITLPVY